MGGRKGEEEREREREIAEKEVFRLRYQVSV
jgi:hypothetical protein